MSTIQRIRAARRALPANVRALGWVSFANDSASELAYPIVPLFLTITLGAPVAAVGVIEGIAEALATGVRLLSGWLSDRTGERRRPWIIGGYGASTLARAVLAAAPAWGWVLGARVVDRVGKGARSTPRDALIRDSTSPELRGSAFGYHRAMDTAGAIIGPLIAVALLEAGVSLRTILWVAFALGFTVLVFLRSVREAPASASGAALPRERSAPLPPGFWAVLGIWFVFSLGNSSDAFLILRARDLGLGVVLVVLAYAVYNVVYASLSWPLGALSDRIPRTLLIGAGLAIFALVYLAFALAHSSWLVWPLFAVYGVYIAATEGVARAWVADTLPDRTAVGTAYGVFFVATAGAALVSSVVAGVLWTYVSPRAPFVVGAVAATVALVLLLAYEAGWSTEPRTVKLLLGVVALACAGAAVAGGVEHRALAHAFRRSEAEPLPAAFVRPCGPAPPAAPLAVTLPARFPTPSGVVYTASRLAGPTTIVRGFATGDLGDALAAYRRELPAAGYEVLRWERDPADAEVAFGNGRVTGQVALNQECRFRVLVRITIRPA